MSKKMMISLSVMAGIAGGMYLYFINNPAKLDSVKHKMIASIYDLEDDMMM